MQNYYFVLFNRRLNKTKFADEYREKYKELKKISYLVNKNRDKFEINIVSIIAFFKKSKLCITDITQKILQMPYSILLR